MARQNIGIGTVANDGTGDSIRVAMDKVNDNFIETYQTSMQRKLALLGSDAKAFPVLVGIGAELQSFVLIDGRASYSAFYLPEAYTLAGLKLVFVGQGDYTEDNFNGIALYTLAGTTLTQVAISANDANYFKTVAGVVSTIPFTAPYVAAAGIYYVGYLFNSSAFVKKPISYATSTGGDYKSALGLNIFPAAYVDAQATLAASIDLSGANEELNSSILSWLY